MANRLQSFLFPATARRRFLQQQDGICALFEGFLVLHSPLICAKISFGSAIPQQIPMRRRRLLVNRLQNFLFPQRQGDPKQTKKFPKPTNRAETSFGSPIPASESPPCRLDGQPPPKISFFRNGKGDPKPKNSQNRQTTPKSALARPFLSESHLAAWMANRLQRFLFSRNGKATPNQKIPKTDKPR